MATTATTKTIPPSLTFFSSSVFFQRQTLKPFLSFKPSTSLKSPSPKPLSITFELATLPVVSFTGEKVGETYLDLKSAPPETARAVVHRGIITDLQNKRRGTASTLTRGEVRGGGKKPYPQKKTGPARVHEDAAPARRRRGFRAQAQGLVDQDQPEGEEAGHLDCGGERGDEHDRGGGLRGQVREAEDEGVRGGAKAVGDRPEGEVDVSGDGLDGERCSVEQEYRDAEDPDAEDAQLVRHSQRRQACAHAWYRGLLERSLRR